MNYFTDTVRLRLCTMLDSVWRDSCQGNTITTSWERSSCNVSALWFSRS